MVYNIGRMTSEIVDAGGVQLYHNREPASKESIKRLKDLIKASADEEVSTGDGAKYLVGQSRIVKRAGITEFSPYVNTNIRFIFEPAERKTLTNHYLVLSFSGNTGEEGFQDYPKLVIRAVESQNSDESINNYMLVYGYGPKESEEEIIIDPDEMRRREIEDAFNNNKRFYDVLLGNDIFDFNISTLPIHPSITEQIENLGLYEIDNPLILGEIPINFEPRFTRVASEAFMTKLEEYLTQQ